MGRSKTWETHIRLTMSYPQDNEEQYDKSSKSSDNESSDDESSDDESSESSDDESSQNQDQEMRKGETFKEYCDRRVSELEEEHRQDNEKTADDLSKLFIRDETAKKRCKLTDEEKKACERKARNWVTELEKESKRNWENKREERIRERREWEKNRRELQTLQYQKSLRHSKRLENKRKRERREWEKNRRELQTLE